MVDHLIKSGLLTPHSNDILLVKLASSSYPEYHPECLSGKRTRTEVEATFEYCLRTFLNLCGTPTPSVSLPVFLQYFDLLSASHESTVSFIAFVRGYFQADRQQPLPASRRPEKTAQASYMTAGKQSDRNFERDTTASSKQIGEASDEKTKNQSFIERPQSSRASGLADSKLDRVFSSSVVKRNTINESIVGDKAQGGSKTQRELSAPVNRKHLLDIQLEDHPSGRTAGGRGGSAISSLHQDSTELVLSQPKGIASIPKEQPESPKQPLERPTSQSKASSYQPSFEDVRQTIVNQ